MRHKLVSSIAFAFIAGACGESPTDEAREKIKLSVLSAQYTTAETIRVALSNDSDVPIAINDTPCGIRLERRLDGVWTYLSFGACSFDTSLLLAGDQVTVSRVASNLVAGEYRFRTAVRWNNSDIAVTSPKFQVVAASVSAAMAPR